MAKRAKDFEVTDVEALAKAYPTLVVKKEIPAQITYRPITSEVRKLLKHGVKLPGVTKK